MGPLACHEAFHPTLTQEAWKPSLIRNAVCLCDLNVSENTLNRTNCNHNAFNKSQIQCYYWRLKASSWWEGVSHCRLCLVPTLAISSRVSTYWLHLVNWQRQLHPHHCHQYQMSTSLIWHTWSGPSLPSCDSHHPMPSPLSSEGHISRSSCNLDLYNLAC